MLLRQTLLYLPAQLLGPLSQFIAAIVWTHLLSLSDYGHLIIVLAAQELVSLVCLSWWTHYTMRYVGKMDGPGERDRFQAAENMVLLLTGIAQVVVITVVVFGFVTGFSAAFLAMSIVYTVTRCVLTHVSERARVDGEIASYTVAQTVGPLGGTLLGLALMVAIDASPVMALLAYSLAQLVSLAVVWLRLKLAIRIKRPELSLMKAALLYGAPLLVAGAFGWFSMNGIRLIVEYMQGAAAVGLLSVGWGLGQRAIAVVAMLVTAASYPLALKYMNAGAHEKSLEQVSLNGALILGVLAPAAAGIYMVGDEAITLMVAEPFRDMSFVILPIAVLAAALRNSRVHFLDQTILLVEKPNLLLQVNAVEAAAMFLFCVLGLKFYGLQGAALGCIPGTLLGWLYCFWLTRGFGLKLPWLHFLRIGIATLVMTAALRYVPFGHGTLQLIGKVAIGALVYFAALSALYVGRLRTLRLRPTV